MPGEAACAGRRGPGQARRARRAACAGSGRGSQSWAAPGDSAGAATSLDRLVGPRRRLDVVAVDLAAIRELGHAHGGTINDVVLAAVAGALPNPGGRVRRATGEVTITVPAAARRAATAVKSEPDRDRCRSPCPPL